MSTRDLRTRRDLLRAGALAATGIGLGPRFALARGELPPTPACEANAAPTARQTEGPFYKPRTPLRSLLREPGMAGTPVDLSGFVLTRDCKPVAKAIVDLWQADDRGDYDNAGFRLRGHQFTDAEGRYQFRTIVPAVYSFRTRHFHVKVAAPYRPVLTTQLYFPDEPKNRADPLFRPELLMRIARNGEHMRARFDFVLDMG
jgi:protocatechuate 3,4-dioxygenase beta subunit